jgi:hypothetical protein
VDCDNYENQYLAYLLYDLLSNDSNGTVDTEEQTSILDSLPWQMKQNFRNAMKKTIQYTNELSSFDINKIPLEQQICLLKTSDHVKEKAMVKLKEVKAKSEDSGAKARQNTSINRSAKQGKHNKFRNSASNQDDRTEIYNFFSREFEISSSFGGQNIVITKSKTGK